MRCHYCIFITIKKDNSLNRAIVSKSFIYLKLYRVTPTV
ncbi:hypothetical protein SPYSS1447_1507 [Streptococcus pyogenes SS1447]|nr:hypothetical protein SPYSS1447_1507 [Streptococcus pyogenes SS1447]